jgi:AraC family transcriptional regulator
MSSYQEQEYIARINTVMDYIHANLNQPLSLKELAKVANFSPYHFHRIFHGITGETLNNFIQRLRIERAASMLIGNPRRSITEIAFDYGFSSSASFARLFKEMYGMSASQWRAGGYNKFSKINQIESKIRKTNSNKGKDNISSSGYFLTSTHDKEGAIHYQVIDNKKITGRIGMTLNSLPDIKVKTISAFTVAYARHIGPYKGNYKVFEDLWKKLIVWAGPRDLMQQQDLKCLCVYHDDPEITDEKSLRLSVCISVPEGTKVDGEIGKMEIPGGKYAVGRYEIDANQYQDAWDYLCGKWMAQSGYQPEDGLCYELMLNDPSQHPQHKHIIEIHVPVKPL